MDSNRNGNGVYRRAFITASLSAAAVAFAGSAAGAAENAFYDVRFPFNGVRVVAPVTVHIAGMHPLRQSWTVATTVKDIAPPDLSFLNASSVVSGAGGAGPDTTPCKDPNTTPAVLTVTEKTRDSCAQLLLKEAGALRDAVSSAAAAEANLIAGIDQILARNPDLRSAAALAAYSAAIKACVFGPRAGGCPTGMPTVGEVRLSVLGLRNTSNAVNADYEQIHLRGLVLPGADARTAQFTGIRSLLDADATEIAKIEDYFDKSIAPLTFGRFVFEADTDRCGGLFNHGRESQIIMTLQTNDTRDVTVVCPTPVFVSAGFGADGLDNRTYTTVPANTAGQPAPAAGATPVPSTIAASGGGQRALAVTMAHVQLGSSPLSYSVGVGASVFGGSGAKVDLLTGLSWSDRRTVVVTAGLAFGRTQVLAPGYAAGGPIAPGATPPTLNRNTSAFFAAITFGR